MEKKSRLLFHNGSLSVTGHVESIKVWYSQAQYNKMPKYTVMYYEGLGFRA